MAKKNPGKALNAFRDQYGTWQQITNIRMGKRGEIFVTMSSKIALPKTFNNVRVITMLKM